MNISTEFYILAGAGGLLCLSLPIVGYLFGMPVRMAAALLVVAAAAMTALGGLTLTGVILWTR